MCLSCICLLAMHMLICVHFSLPPGVGGWLRLLLDALRGLFHLPFSINLELSSQETGNRKKCISSAVVALINGSIHVHCTVTLM